MLKRFNVFLFLILIGYKCQAQHPCKSYPKESVLSDVKLDPNLKNKTILPQFEEATKVALSHYPELDKVNIIFKYKNNKSLLSTHISLLSMLKKKKNRIYIVIISSQTNKHIQSILLSKLSFNAQVGVLGHELAHIATFNLKSFAYFIKLAFLHLSIKQMDKYESNTDVITIMHNLGYQLLAWSNEVRVNLNNDNWGGSNNPTRKRYLNPDRIQAILDTSKLYNKVNITP